MMGYAGQLSLGHALYVGLGGYTAALLWFYFGIGPWLGVFAAVVIAMAFGAVIGWLGFRFGVEGVYFALLTIALAEFTRIAFDNMSFTGGSGGLFLPYEQRSARPSGGTCAADRCSSIIWRSRSRRAASCWRRALRARGSAINGWRCARTRWRRARSASTPFAPR